MNKQWVLITGASSGIGYAITKKILDEGKFNLVLVARLTDSLMQLLSKYDTQSFIYKLDLSKLEDIEALFYKTKELNIKFFGFIHCAGLAPLMKVQELNIKLAMDTFHVNYLSFMVMMKYLSMDCYTLDSTRIVALSSIAVNRKGQRQSIYAASKAALENSISYLAYCLKDRKFVIVGLALGAVETEMFHNMCEKSDDLYSNILKKQPLGIFSVDAVANYTYDLLCKDIYGCTTGVIYELNGGNQ